MDPVFLSFVAKRALFEAPVPDNDGDDGGDDDDDDDDFVDTQRDHFIVSVSFMDGSAASFDFAEQPEEHELRTRICAEVALSEDRMRGRRVHPGQLRI